MIKKIRVILYLIAGIMFAWFLLTLFVQYAGKQKSFTYTADTAVARALIVYNPDPFNNLDEKLCKSFAAGLKQEQVSSNIKTVKLAQLDTNMYDLLVVCANTYNYSPDWRITRFINEHKGLKQHKVVAITLGAGLTEQAQYKLESIINRKDAILLDSRSFWLLKPNDEQQQDANNLEVAEKMVKNWAITLVKTMPQQENETK